MDIRQGLLAARADLQMLKAAKGDMPAKISGEEAFYRRLNSAMAPKAAQMPEAAVGTPSRDILYMERLRKILNSPQAASLDLNVKGR